MIIMIILNRSACVSKNDMRREMAWSIAFMHTKNTQIVLTEWNYEYACVFQIANHKFQAKNIN